MPRGGYFSILTVTLLAFRLALIGIGDFVWAHGPSTPEVTADQTIKKAFTNVEIDIFDEIAQSHFAAFFSSGQLYIGRSGKGGAVILSRDPDGSRPALNLIYDSNGSVSTTIVVPLNVREGEKVIAAVGSLSSRPLRVEYLQNGRYRGTMRAVVADREYLENLARVDSGNIYYDKIEVRELEFEWEVQPNEEKRAALTGLKWKVFEVSCNDEGTHCAHQTDDFLMESTLLGVTSGLADFPS